jgi:hypothetical protein
VIYAGAGIRLRKNASARALRTTIGPVIDDPRYRAAAQHMAARLASEREDNRAIDELEQVAARGPATGKRTASPRRRFRPLRGGLPWSRAPSNLTAGTRTAVTNPHAI